MVGADPRPGGGPLMRWLVTGGTGMLGRDLARALNGDVAAPGRDELDITDADAVDAALEDVDVVVNAAAFTAVDDAEADEDRATEVNGIAAGRLAAAAHARGAGFVQISTDYVFDGRATAPYRADAPLSPLNAYGRGKALGERLVAEATEGRALIVRTAWLYGAGGHGFVRAIAARAPGEDIVPVVTDQVGQPTWTAEVAEGVARLIAADAPGGVYHATSRGHASRFLFARAIFEELGADPERIAPADSLADARPARRPAWSVLDHASWTRIGLAPLRDWREALHEAAREGALNP